VDIKAANGDFVQSYVDNFFHIGGDPKAIYEGTTTPGGVIANGNVFISSRYININGIIQSGIASYTLTLPTGGATLTGSASMLGLTLAGNNQAAMDAYRVAHPTGVTTFTNDRGQPVTYNAAKNRLEVSEAFAIADAASAQGKTRNPTGEYALVSDYGNVGARYDTANDRYLINGTEVKGGYIQLFGQIINTAKPDAGGTNAGKLLVLDGYGQINIANPSGKDIVIARLDAGQGTAGVIDITDIQYIDASKAAHSIRSVFTRENGNVKITQKGRWTLDGSGPAGVLQRQLDRHFDDQVGGWRHRHQRRNQHAYGNLQPAARTRLHLHHRPGSIDLRGFQLRGYAVHRHLVLAHLAEPDRLPHCRSLQERHPGGTDQRPLPVRRPESGEHL
jgi:hypothetical protein